MGLEVANVHSDFGYRLVCRLSCKFLSLVVWEAVAKENKNNHGAEVVSRECFDPAVIMGFEVANIHWAFGDSLGCRLRCKFLLCFEWEAVAKENKNNRFIGFAEAVLGVCFNPAVIIGLEVASIHLDLG